MQFAIAIRYNARPPNPIDHHAPISLFFARDFLPSLAHGKINREIDEIHENFANESQLAGWQKRVKTKEIWERKIDHRK
jgi:hypothetical protein